MYDQHRNHSDALFGWGEHLAVPDYHLENRTDGLRKELRMLLCLRVLRPRLESARYQFDAVIIARARWRSAGPAEVWCRAELDCRRRDEGGAIQ